VQLVLLPHVFPGWHAGHGLLVGGDWVRFHSEAVALAAKIQAEGWSAWELRPDGQAPVGIAAATYALTTSQPWTLIPLNAALHAAAGLALLRIIQLFVPNWRLAIWPVLPFLLYPSAMQWYTQIHKDGYSILGAFLFAYGWALFARSQTWESRWRQPSRAVLWIVLGGSLAWVVRPYAVQVMQGLGGVLALILTCVFMLRMARAVWPWHRATRACLLVWLTVIAFTPLTRGEAPVRMTRGEAPVRTSFPSETTFWRTSGYLPSFVEDKLRVLAANREAFRVGYPHAASNIDIGIGLHSAGDVVAYLPRAAEIAFLAPFPRDWFAAGSLEANTMMRRVSAFEMLGIYLALVLLPYALWHWRRRVELWVLVTFGTGMSLVYAVAITNVGALYRMRYGYVMILVALGLTGGLAAWRDFARKGLES